MKDLTGAITALATPFERGSGGAKIDEASLRALARQQLEGGIRGFVIAGTTGESPTLSDAERRALFAIVKSECSQSEYAKQTSLILGTGSNDTRQSIAWTREAAELGADAALVVVPYYNKPPQRGLVAHYQAIAGSSAIPILLYNVPGRTVAKLDVETVAELSRVSNIVGIKEATGDVAFGAQILAACPKDFIVTSGDDETAFELMLKGAKGVISVASHILPHQFVEFTRRARAGDAKAPKEFKEQFVELVKKLFCEANPIPVKTALFQMGVIASPDLRLPLVSLGAKESGELRSQLKRARVIA